MLALQVVNLKCVMATREGEYFNILCVWIAPLFGICLDYDKDTLTVTGKN